MMKNKFNLIVMISILVLLLGGIVQAAGFGSSQKNTYSQVKKGETAEFTILFWNVKDSSIPINLKVRQVPEDMPVIIRPDEFILNSSKVTEFPAESGKDYVNTQYGLMRTTPVRVLVKVPDDTEEGEYEVLIDAVAGESITGISTLLEKTFKFSVNVTSLTFFERLSKVPEKLISGISDIGKGITGMFTTPADSRIVLIILIIIGISVVFWIIYKRAKHA